jgi:hypothetical protein
MDIFIPTMLKYGYTVAVVFVMGRVFYYTKRCKK